MLIPIILILVLIFILKVRKENFGWSCTFTPSFPSHVDMGTVRDQQGEMEYRTKNI